MDFVPNNNADDDDIIVLSNNPDNDGPDPVDVPSEGHSSEGDSGNDLDRAIRVVDGTVYEVFGEDLFGVNEACRALATTTRMHNRAVNQLARAMHLERQNDPDSLVQHIAITCRAVDGMFSEISGEDLFGVGEAYRALAKATRKNNRAIKQVARAKHLEAQNDPGRAEEREAIRTAHVNRVLAVHAARAAREHAARAAREDDINAPSG